MSVRDPTQNKFSSFRGLSCSSWLIFDLLLLYIDVCWKLVVYKWINKSINDDDDDDNDDDDGNDDDNDDNNTAADDDDDGGSGSDDDDDGDDDDNDDDDDYNDNGED